MNEEFSRRRREEVITPARILVLYIHVFPRTYVLLETWQEQMVTDERPVKVLIVVKMLKSMGAVDQKVCVPHLCHFGQ